MAARSPSVMYCSCVRRTSVMPPNTAVLPLRPVFQQRDDIGFAPVAEAVAAQALGDETFLRAPPVRTRNRRRSDLFPAWPRRAGEWHAPQ